MDFVNQKTSDDTGLYEFLNNAPKYFREGERIRKYTLHNGDVIHCVLWYNHFYITGTDIVKILVWRFQNANKQVVNMKKFEEGIFSDLRNLKPGQDASLEGPRSEFLEFLYKSGCIRTQKKQKVFYWYSVPHEPLFCDALERDMRRDNSHHNYNGYIPDHRQKYRETTPNTIFQPYPSVPSQQYFSPVKFETNKSIEKVADDRNDLFNIKKDLFGDYNVIPNSDPQRTFRNDYSFDNLFINANDPNQASKPVKMAPGVPLGPKITQPGKSIISPKSHRPPSYSSSTFDDFDDESKLKQIKTNVGKALGSRFASEDLSQFEFLNERWETSFRASEKIEQANSNNNADKSEDKKRINFYEKSEIEQL